MNGHHETRQPVVAADGPPAPIPRLVDGFGRHITYVRLSVTDRCDLRCSYCMGENPCFLPTSSLLTLDELARLGRIFVSLGVNKIRITGGEPLARSRVIDLFRNLGHLPELQDLTLTTNGTRLARLALPLRDAGVHRINISLDSLRAERFRNITRVDAFHRVMRGIDAALAAGFRRVKLNSVIMTGHNEDEVVSLARFALDRGLDISFIEEMPLGAAHGHDRNETFFSSDRVLQELTRHFVLTPAEESTSGPSRYYRVAGHPGRIGFISPHSHNFCDTCNRVRVTAEGRLLLCLGQEHSVDLRQLLRAGQADDEPVRHAIVDALTLKPRGHEFDPASRPVILRRMNVTGG